MPDEPTTDDPTDADPVPAPSIEEAPSTTGVVVDDDELDDG